jgi:hypothetical protein
MTIRCHRINPSATEVSLGPVVALFSYATLVAVLVQGRGFYRTRDHHSPTTSRHINAWLNGAKATPIDPNELQALVLDPERRLAA